MTDAAGSLIRETIPLALGAAVSPVLFLLQVTTLTGKRRLARGSALALGAFVPLAAAGLLAVATGIKLSFSTSTKARADVVLGVLLLALGAHAALRAPKPKAPRTVAPGLGPSFVTGAAGMATNASTLALFMPAAVHIATSHASDADKVIVTVIVVLIVMTSVLVPLLLTAIAPRASGRVLETVSRALTRNTRTIEIVFGIGFGTWLVVRGVAKL